MPIFRYKNKGYAIRNIYSTLTRHIIQPSRPGGNRHAYLQRPTSVNIKINTMTHYRFDRHKLFSMDDTSEVLDIISEVRHIDSDDDNLPNLTNMLYGLFDGFLYDNILTTAASIIDLPIKTIKRIEAIVDKCTNDILINGQSITRV